MKYNPYTQESIKASSILSWEVRLSESPKKKKISKEIGKAWRKSL